MSPNGTVVRTHFQESPISNKHVQEPNSTFHHEKRSPGGQGHRIIHTIDLSVEDHIIYSPNFDIHITLFLHGILSYLSEKQMRYSS